MNDATSPSVSSSQIVDGLRAANAYCRAMEALRGGLGRTEQQALRWCLFAEEEFAAVWEASTKAERDEVSDLSAKIAEYVEPYRRGRRRRAAPAPRSDDVRSRSTPSTAKP